MSRKITFEIIKETLRMDDEDLHDLGFCNETIYDEFGDYQNSESDDSDEYEPDCCRNEDKADKISKLISKVESINDNDDNYDTAPNEILLDTPFSYLLIAKPGSGKSTLLINMLKWYAGYFDQIYIWSPTFSLDVSWQIAIDDDIIDVDKKNIFKKYSENKLVKIFNSIKKKNKGIKTYDEKVKTLFIFDDIVGELPRKSKTIFNNISRNHRHYGISHITLSQEYKAVAPVFRKNTFGVCLWNSGNSLERKAIVEEVAGAIGMNRFERMWIKATNTSRFDFLYIKQFEHDIRKKYYQNFENVFNPYSFANDKIKLNEEIPISTIPVTDINNEEIPVTDINNEEIIEEINDEDNDDVEETDLDALRRMLDLTK